MTVVKYNPRLLKVSARSPISKICPATRNMTPTGASMMIHCVILMTMTVMEVKNLRTGSASSPTMAMAMPKKREPTIIPRMFEPSDHLCSKSHVNVSFTSIDVSVKFIPKIIDVQNNSKLKLSNVSYN